MYPLAVSEEDLLTESTDDITSDIPTWADETDWLDKWRRHIPLGVRVTGRSYAWGAPQNDDIVFFDWTITNLGEQTLNETFVGLFVEPAVYYEFGYDLYGSGDDDVCGFLQTYLSAGDCNTEDTVNIAWSADNDGEPENGQFVQSSRRNSHPHILGLHLLGRPERELQLSYNWWVTNEDPRYDWGPRARPWIGSGIRDFQTGGLGTPWGDRNSYYQMSNGEVDYDLPRMPTVSGDQRWLPPTPIALNNYATGADISYLLSIGPYELGPGEEVKFPFAVVAGENFHTDPANGDRLRSGNVSGYMARLDFSSLVKNCEMADRIYDNPGVDTDGDGYSGKHETCIMDSIWIDSQWVYSAAETTWTEGDGVPDWRAALPPPPPHVWVTPRLNGVHVRFNGYNSETTKDYFTREIDFEGYRVYLGRDERESSLALAAQFDLRNYDRYVYRRISDASGEWECRETPFLLEELRCLYGRGADRCNDSTFDPLRYTRGDPLLIAGGDTAIYFAPHEANVWQLGQPDIYKLYPDAPRPTAADSINPAAKTEDGYYKYYEYACDIANLLPTVRYYINVTAFDFGSAAIDQPPLETSKTDGILLAYPFADEGQAGDELPPVYVYPNPYLGDGRYRADGYEARGDPRIDDRVREIHFVNVPLHCWIRIFTLDGDLVRAIRHDALADDPNGHHDTWDMINRNIMAVESGLYYWSVEADDGKVQIGKLVIIK